MGESPGAPRRVPGHRQQTRDTYSWELSRHSALAMQAFRLSLAYLQAAVGSQLYLTLGSPATQAVMCPARRRPSWSRAGRRWLDRRSPQSEPGSRNGWDRASIGRSGIQNGFLAPEVSAATGSNTRAAA